MIGPASLATQTVGPSAGRRRAACERRRRARPTRGAAHGPAYSAHEIRAQVLGTGWVCVVSVARKARFCRYCSDRLAAPSSVSRPRGSRRSQPRSTKGIPAVRILSVPESNSASGPSVPVHPRDGRCLRSEFSPRSKQRPAELEVAAAAEFRRVIVDYLDRNVVEPQTILIEPPDGSANRSDRPVSGTVCR